MLETRVRGFFQNAHIRSQTLENCDFSCCFVIDVDIFGCNKIDQLTKMINLSMTREIAVVLIEYFPYVFESQQIKGLIATRRQFS